MWDLGFVINETVTVPSGQMIWRHYCYVGFGLSLSMKHVLRRVARWSAKQRHYCYVGFGFSYQ